MGAASSGDLEGKLAPDAGSIVVLADGGGLFVVSRVALLAGSGRAHGSVVAAAAIGDGIDTGG